MLLETTGGGGVMVIVSVALPVPVILEALIVTNELPSAGGDPEIRPVIVLTERPPGNPTAL